MMVFTNDKWIRALDDIKRITLLILVVLSCVLTDINGQCNSTFYDTGGASGNYSNNQNYTQTYTAPAGSTINVDFISFNLESGYDKLYVYDGPNTSSTLVATLSGSAIPNDIVSSGRYITFRFISDNSVIKPGWQIYITCNTLLDCTNIPTLDFQNPTLVSGTFGAVGSTYLFSDVLAGVADAVLTIVAKSHSDIVITSLDAPYSLYGGYDESFQPIIDYDWKNSNGSNDPSGDKYITFKVDFFSAGTNTPVTVPQLAVTGIDIDGDATTNGIREFLRSSGYQSYSLQSSTQLSLSGALKALGPVTNYAQINENALDVMLSFNYSGVSSITFDYGANYGGATSNYADERYNSLFFKCYGFDQTVCQPVNAPTGISASRCGTGPVILSSSGCNGTVRWYTSANGGSSLHDGPNFITPILTATKIYYIECYDVGCVSDLRSPVTATINSNCQEICDNNIDDDGDGDVDCDDLDCGEVLNREFDEGAVNWSLYNQSGNSALFKIDNTSQLSGINSAYIDIANSNGTTDWHTQLVSTGHSLEIGKTYSIYFDAKAATNKAISVALQLDNSPFTTYFYTSEIVTTSSQSFYYEFTANVTSVNDINFLFNIGADATDIWIDNVQFKESCDQAEICDNGIDDDGDGLIDSVDPDCPQNETCSCSGTNLFDNGDFESGSYVGTTTFITGQNGDDLGYNWGTPVGLDGWSHGPLWWLDAPAVASQGNRCVYINNSSGGSVCQGQYFNLGSGIGNMNECATYQLCFDWASFNRENPNGRSTTSRPAVDFTWFDASDNELGVTHESLGTPVANQDWGNIIWSSVSFQFSFTGTHTPPAGASYVRVNISEDGSGQDNGILLDNANLCVVVPCIPACSANITGTTPGSRCSAGSVVLGATSNGGTIKWYASASGGPILGTGTSFITPSISTTTTYYVEADNGTCVIDPRTPVTAEVIAPTTISSQVNSSSDDAEESLSDNSVNINSSDLELAVDGSTSQLVGMRFTQIDVPQGSTISNAYIEFETDVAWTSAANLVINGQAVDDAATFSGTNSNLSSRPKTNASSNVSWSPLAWNTVNEKHNTPDIKNIIQEIVNRPGWITGNDLALFISGTGTREAESYDGESSAAPKLYITYICTPIEICGNGIDDDGDGLIDNDDPDCGSDCPIGGVRLERWLGLSGTAISDLTSSPNYPNNPSETAFLTSLDVNDNIADNFGTRIEGYIVPSESGNYIFNLTSDDAGEFYLSSNGDPINKTLVSSVNGWTGPLEYTKYPSQTSLSIYLSSGVNYYFEVLHKEGIGLDNLQVSWKTPSNSNFNIIPGANLRPFYCFETCGNGIDDDGDGAIDSNDPDCFSCAAGLIQNPDFSSDLTNWSNWGNSTIESESNGNKFARVSALGGFGQNVPALPERLYTLKALGRTSGTTSASVGISFRDASNNIIGEYTETISTAFFNEYTISQIAPPNTVYVVPFVWRVSGTGNADADGFCLTETIICENSADSILVCNGGIAPLEFDLEDASNGSLWSLLYSPPNTSPSINSNTGLITNMDGPGQYIATLTGGACIDTVEIVVPSCEEPCLCDDSDNAGYADWSALGMTPINGPTTNVFSVPIPGHSTVLVTQTLIGGGKTNQTNNNFTNPNRPAFQALGYGSTINQPMYIETASSGNVLVNFDFSAPMGDFDLLIFDVDEYDDITISAKDASGNIITNLSGWKIRGIGDATQWEGNGPVSTIAPPPNIDLSSGKVTSSNTNNYNRNFVSIRPDVLISEITLSYTSVVGGNHVYYDIYGTLIAQPCVEVNNNNNSIEFTCIGDTYQMHPNTNVTWSSDNTSVATVSMTGLVTALGPGIANLTYTNTLSGCDSDAPYVFEIKTPIEINTTVGPCIDQALKDIAEVSITVSWTSAPSNNDIIVSYNGATEIIDVSGGALSPQVFNFMVAADGSNNNTVTANWDQNSNCASSATYVVPAACSADTLSCSILYLCGLDKPFDGDAYDHGVIEYILENNGNSNFLPILTKDELGMGTYNPMDASLFVPINLSDYELIIISPTTEGHMSSDLINALKTFPGGILLGNYLIQDELGMTNGASAQGYIWSVDAFTDNTTSEQILNYNNPDRWSDYLTTNGDPFVSADQFLWANSGDQANGENAIIYRYDASDVLPGISSHGPRVYAGFHMNGIYANGTNGGVLPSPSSAWFNPIKHLTVKGKEFFDMALVMAGTNCVPEICDNGKDDDLDGLTDCDDPECTPTNANIITSANTICDGGSILLTATPGFTYQWSANAGSVTTDTVTVYPNPSASFGSDPALTIYSVTVTDGSGCTNTANTTIGSNALPSVSVNDDSICPDEIGNLQATATMGDFATTLNYLWSNSATTTNINISPSSMTDYIVTVTDNLGCFSIDTGTVFVESKPSVSISGDSQSCSGDSITLTANASDGSNAIVGYDWSNGTNNVSTTVSPVSDSTFFITVTSTTGCKVTDLHTIFIIKESIPLKATASLDTICIGGSTVLTINKNLATGGLIDYSTWTVGSGDAPGFSVNGSNSENYRINGTDPWGNPTVVWEARPDQISGSDGGWNGTSFNIDNTKTYRVSTWVNRKIAGVDGKFYFGLTANGSVNGVKTRTSGATSTNPFFYVTPNSTTLPEDEWVLVVGHVYPSGATGSTNHPESGRYSAANGFIGAINYDYQWLPQTTSAMHRSYLDFGTDTTTRQQWVYPRFDVIDGTEPSIQELLNGFDINGGLGQGATWEWFSDSCGVNFVGTGNSISVSPTSTTTYFVRGSGVCGVTACKDVTVYISDISTPSIDYNGSVCITNSTQLTANVNGGNAPFTYNWVGPNSFTGATQTINIVDDGSYLVTITDNNGCNVATSGFINEEYTPFIITLNSGVCEGVPVDLSVESPGAVSYLWDSNASNQTTKVATVYPTPPSTTYHVTVTNDLGCTAVPEVLINVTLKPTLNLIGPDSICIGETTTMSASSPGNWTALNSSVAVINSSGMVTGLSKGKARFIFTQSSNNCQSDTSAVIEVKGKTPVSLIGPNTICESSTTQLLPSSGGTWTSSNNSIATVGNTGLVTGINQGTAFFIYTNDTTGCVSNPSTSVTVEKGNGATLSGPNSTCIGATIQLTASPKNGSWVSEDPSVATINAVTGVVTPLTEGIVIIRYNHNAGSCSVQTSKTIVVKGPPSITYSSENASCSSNDGVISIGIVDHPSRTQLKISKDNGANFITIPDNIGTYDFENLSPGTYDIVTKWSNDECEIYVGQIVIIDTNPAPISIISTTNEPCGSTQGGSISFQISAVRSTDQMSISLDGGVTWPYTVYDTIGNFTINNILPGSYDISTKWIDDSCEKIDTTITILSGINNLGTISPNDTICYGETKLITASGGTSYTWSNSQTGPSISVSPTSTTSYTVSVTLSNGCVSVKNTTVMVVNQLNLNLDFNGGICLTDTSKITAIHSGGLAPFQYLWAGPSGPAGSTKTININEGGNYYLTLTDNNGCQAYSSGFIYQRYEPFIVNLQTRVCEGASVNLNVNASNAISYQWSASAGNATTPSVTVLPVVPMSNYTVTVTNNLGCAAIANGDVNVDPAPTVSLSGNDTICTGAQAQLSPTTGGFWNSTNQLVAQVNNTGLVTGITSGYADFYYIENTNYCTSLNPIRIDVLTDEIVGFSDDQLCIGDTTYLSPNTGGVWSTTNPTAFSVSNDGMVIALTNGQGKFKFTLDGFGCVSTTIGQITVHPTPITAFEGGNNLCLGQTTSITPTTGGLWTSVNPAIASIDNNGLITGISIGTAKFIFQNGDTGCLSDTSSALFVTNNPVPIVDGPTSICEGQTTKLLPSTGGVWYSTNNSIATITSNGIVNGIYAGTARFYFISDGGLCISDTSEVITIYPKPTISLNGDNLLCLNETTTFSPSTGGSWMSSNNSIATITSSGTATAVAAGVATFTFTNTTTNCVSDPSVPITVFSKPIITVTGVDSICVGTTTSISPTTGGVWTSSSNAIAIISSSGIITGMGGGVATFTFKENQSDCVSDPSIPITVIARPIVSITGPSIICEGSTTTLAPTTGGYWTSDNPTIATVTTSGIVTGNSQGLVRFTFVSDFGCTSNKTAPIIVNGKPKPTFTGSPSICIGSTMNILPNAGGVWVSNKPLIASITNAGLITGLSAGDATFTFTDTLTGCASDASTNLTVNNLPPINIPVGSRLCVGATLNAAPSSGGTWQSMNTAIASISNSGLITGISAGSTQFRYQSLSTGCLSALSTPVLVDPKPVISISGPSAICVGDTTNMLPSIGGSWVSNSPTIASINNSGRILALKGGISRFRFTSTYNCASDLSSPITVNAAPPIGLSGPQYICIGETTNIYPGSGGTWQSSDPSIAIIENNGLVIGVSEGTVNATFTDVITGCESTEELEIFILAPPIISLNGDSEICMGYNTSVSANSEGSWITSDPRIASISNDGIITGLAPGIVEISFIDGLTGCKNQNLNIEITVSKCLNHDFNVTLVGVIVEGDISTNDNTPINGIYNSTPTLKSKPSGSVYSLTMGPNGTYNFSANKEGKYIFETQVCIPPTDFGCPKSLLEFTVLGDVYGMNNPVNNLEFITTFANDDDLLPGDYIESNAMQNDLCVSGAGCNLNIVTTNIVNNATNGIGTYLGLGKLSYIPNSGYIGKDVITYKVCSDIDPTNCSTSSTYVTVASTTAPNTVVAPDDFNYILSGESVTGNASNNDSDPEGDNLTVVPQGSISAPIVINGGSFYIEADGSYTFNSDLDFEGPTSFVYTICDDNAESVCMDATVHLLVFGDMKITVKAYLEGALINNGGQTSALGAPLMRDNLRQSPFDGKNYIPLNDPYTSGVGLLSYGIKNHIGPGLMNTNQIIQDSASVFSVSGDNAIVDWVYLELRSKNDYTQAISTRSALIQRDGDVVDLDGTSAVRFNGFGVDSFYVVLMHRNHLGIMSNLVSSSDIIDFTDLNTIIHNFGFYTPTGLNYTGLTGNTNIKPGYRALWAGDFNSNGKIGFIGGDDDSNVIITDVLLYPENYEFKANFDFAYGYFNGDYDMNSKVKFTNPSDDTNMLFTQLLLYVLNQTFASNFGSFIQQVPNRSN